MENNEVDLYVKNQFGSDHSVKELTPVSGLENVVVGKIQRVSQTRSIYTDQNFDCKNECLGIILKRNNGSFDYRNVLSMVGNGGYDIFQTYGSRCEVNRLKYDSDKRMLSISATRRNKGSTEVYFYSVEAEMEVLKDELGHLKIKKILRGEADRNIFGNYGYPKMKDVTDESGGLM